MLLILTNSVFDGQLVTSCGQVHLVDRLHVFEVVWSRISGVFKESDRLRSHFY